MDGITRSNMHQDSARSAWPSVQTDALLDVLALGLFTFVFTAQLLRVALGWGMQIGPYSVPVAASYLAIILAGVLTYGFAKKTLSASGVLG